MSGNLRSPRARWCPGHAMASHDRLPPELRRFMIDAALPWSAASVLRIWRRARAQGESRAAALARIERAAAGTLRREVALIWGEGHPQAAAQSTNTVTSGRSVSASPSAR